MTLTSPLLLLWGSCLVSSICFPNRRELGNCGRVGDLLHGPPLEDSYIHSDLPGGLEGSEGD